MKNTIVAFKGIHLQRTHRTLEVITKRLCCY